MKSVCLRSRSLLNLFVIFGLVSSFALAFGYRVIASRIKPVAPKPSGKARPALTPVLPQSAQEDNSAAQEFFRFKRLPAGEKLLSPERYAPARQKVMSQATAKASSESASRLVWQPLNSAARATNPWANAKFYSGAIFPDGKSFLGGTANHGVVRATANEGSWEQLQSGLGSAVAVDQNEALFFSQAGALHRSTDGGRSFVNIASALKDTSLFVTPFVVDSVTSQRIWLGGTAVWRTQDGGAAWQQASSTLHNGKISALQYAVSNHNFVLAGTSGGTIYRIYQGLTSTSKDDWLSATPRAGYVSSLVVEPENPNVVYATYATFGGAHVWRSEDAGATWQSIDGAGDNGLPDVPVHSLVLDPRNAQRLFIGTDIGIFATTDGGKTWTNEATELGGAIVESLVLQTTNDDVKLFAFTYGNGVWQTNLSLEAECTYSVGTPSNASAPGGSYSVFISTSSECGWTATSNVNWITITSSKAGKGSASISYTIPPNYEVGARTGTMTIGGQTVTITQNGLAPTCEVKPIQVGETVTGTVKAGPCTPLSNSSSTTYNATYFTFTVNPGEMRALSFQGEFGPQIYLYYPTGAANYQIGTSATNVRVPSSNFLTLTQGGIYLVEVSNYFSTRGNFTLSLLAPTASPGCSAFSLSTNAQSFEAAGGNGDVDVSGGAACPWTFKSNATWITSATTNGTGDGRVNFTVAANTTTTSRSGVIEIAGQTFTVTQAGTGGSCAATPVNIGQTVNGTLSTGDCNSRYNFDTYPARPSDLYTFTATEGQQVVIATNSPTMTLQLSLVDQNGSPLTPYGFRTPLGTGYVTIPKTGTYTLELTTNYFNSFARIGSYALSVLSAASGCGYVVPSGTGFKGYEAGGGNGSVGVTSGNGCGWIATTHYDWIKINTPTGTSSGNVEFTLTANNTGRSRIGAILISGQSFFLEQAATGGTCLPSPITPGEPVKGSLDPSDCLSTYDTDAYATDRYQFQATAGQQLRVDVNPASLLGMRVYLLDANNRLIQRSTGSFPTGNGFFTIPATGSYNLEIATTASIGSVPYSATISLVTAGCSYTAAAVSNYFETPGGEGSIDLTAGNECRWNVSTAASWITLATSGGSGTGHVNFTVAPNSSTGSRNAVINVAGQVLTINQAGTSGSCTEQPLSVGQTVSGRLTTGDCRSRIVASSSTQYADRYSFGGLEGQQILLGLRAAFSNATMYLAEANGKILANNFSRIPSIGGYFQLPATGNYFVEVVSSSQQDYTLSFALLPTGCSLALTPDIATIEASGGNGSFKIIAGPDCPWSITDLPAWVTLSAGNSGSGSSTVNFTVTPNTTNARRRATLGIGGQSFVIEQSSAGGTCSTTPIAAGQTVKGSLGAADCRPDVQETIRPITDRYSFTGTAGQQMALTAVAETINNFIPTMALTVLDPTGAIYVRNNQRVPGLGFVTLPSDGTYTVEITSSSASSTTTVNYALTLEAIAPQCSFTATPINNLFEATGGTGSLTITATNACSWSISGVPSWITISAGASGAGNGTVSFQVAENTTTASREVTLIVGGNPMRIEQAGKGGSCGATLLTLGQTVTGTTNSPDCRSRFRTSASSFNSYYARQFSFAFTAGQQLALTATNTSGFSFTPYLYVYNDKGIIVAQGETRLPAGIGFLTLPEAGTYFVEVTSRDGSFSSSYTWSLNLSAPTACAVSLLPQATRFEDSGGMGSVGIVAGSGCPWTVQSDAEWLTVSEGGSGSGNGQIKFTIANNALGSSRRGTLTIAGQTLSIEQAGAGGTGATSLLTFGQTIEGNLLPADYTTPYSFYTAYVDRYFIDASAGQQLALSLTTNNSTSFPDQALRILAPSGSEVAVATTNPGALWTRLPVNGRYVVEVISRFATDYRLNAELVAATCNFVARPADQTFEPGGGTGSFELVGPADCAWLVDRIPNWLTFTTTHYQGTARVEFEVLPNISTSLRSADLLVAGQTVRVQQVGFGGTCAVKSIAPGQAVNGTLSSQDCRKSSSGNYYHRYRFNAAAGDQIATIVTGTNRISLLNAAGETLATSTSARLPEGTGYFTIPRSGAYFVDVESSSFSPVNYALNLVTATPGCNYVLSANGQGFDPKSGGGRVQVRSLSGCAWTASSNASWVTIYPANGSGNGDVNFVVAANTSVNLRRANLTIAGQAFVVEQAGVGGLCTPLPLAPNQTISGSIGTADCQTRKLYTFDATAGQQALLTLNSLSGTALPLSLLAPDGATLATVNNSALNVIPASGGYLTLPTTGTYTVVVTGFASRYDYRLSLQLVERSCSFDVVNSAQPFAATGGSGALNVNSNNGCGWTSLSLSSWVQIKAGSSGSGTGKVEYTVAASTDTSSRRGTILVAGKTLTIDQAGAGATCQITPLNPGQFVTGTLGSNDCRSRALTSAYPAEWYSFTGNAGDQLLVQFTGSFTPTLSLLTTSGTVLRTARSETLPSNSGFFTLPNSGEYWIEVSSENFSAGSYRISFVTAAPGCGFNLSSTEQKFEAAGGTGRFNLSANGTCQWYAYSDASWITVSGTGSGAGNAAVNYTVAANTTGLSRLGRIYLSGQIYLVEQAGTGGTCQTMPIKVGETITGAVTEADCRTLIKPSNPSSFVQRAEMYSFTGMAGDRIVVTATAQGTTFTPQLSLFTTSGQLLRQGSRIPNGGGSYTLPANGTYWLEVSTTGGYSVKLELQ